MLDDHTIVELSIIAFLAIFGWWQRRIVARIDRLDELKANKASTDQRFKHVEKQHERMTSLLSDVRSCLARIEGKVDAACK